MERISSYVLVVHGFLLLAQLLGYYCFYLWHHTTARKGMTRSNVFFDGLPRECAGNFFLFVFVRVCLCLQVYTGQRFSFSCRGEAMRVLSIVEITFLFCHYFLL